MASADVQTPAGWPGTTIDRTRKRIKDGHHVVLDFYDLLIEAIMKSILSGVLRGKNATERGENCVGALRIEFIELSRYESMGIDSFFGR